MWFVVPEDGSFAFYTCCTVLGLSVHTTTIPYSPECCTLPMRKEVLACTDQDSCAAQGHEYDHFHP